MLCRARRRRLHCQIRLPCALPHVGCIAMRHAPCCWPCGGAALIAYSEILGARSSGLGPLDRSSCRISIISISRFRQRLLHSSSSIEFKCVPTPPHLLPPPPRPPHPSPPCRPNNDYPPALFRRKPRAAAGVPREEGFVAPPKEGKFASVMPVSLLHI